MSTTMYQNASSLPAVPQSQVNKEISMMDETTTGLNAHLDNLETLLASVLRPPSPEETPPMNEPALVPLAVSLHAINVRLDALFSRVTGIMKRLEL